MTYLNIQWLTYWVVYAVFNVFEAFSSLIIFWFPFYYSFKFGFLIWLFMPNTRGAHYLYVNFLLPVFLSTEQSHFDKPDRLDSEDVSDENEETKKAK